MWGGAADHRSSEKKMRKPRIAICTDIREFDGNSWHVTPRQYIEAAAQTAALTPMLVPCLPSQLDADDVLDGVCGLLLSGSKTNVHPSRYGAEVKEDNGPFDQARDEMAFALIRAAIHRRLPILAICRGMQELNVSLGGDIMTEIQTMPGIHDHRHPETDDLDEKFVLSQCVNVTTGGRLSSILGKPQILVNSLHRQALGVLGEGLVVEARADDGIIEAVSLRDAGQFVLGVQWHPEYWAATDPTSSAIFRAFGDAVRQTAIAGEL